MLLLGYVGSSLSKCKQKAQYAFERFLSDKDCSHRNKLLRRIVQNMHPKANKMIASFSVPHPIHSLVVSSQDGYFILNI